MDERPRLSRRTMIAKSLVAASGRATFAAGCSTPGLPKVSKAHARYQDWPNGTQRSAGCTHFVAPNLCTIADSDISPHGWSTCFLAKTG